MGRDQRRGTGLTPARAAAFGSDPGAAVRVRPGAAPAQRWLVAVALGGQGHYAAAATALHGLLADPDVPEGVAAHAAVTIAAHRRQLGGHAAARRHDALGLRLAAAALEAPGTAPPGADGTDPLAARVDALVGLAADALGAARWSRADVQRLLDAAAEARHPSWRPAVRAGWVAAELALRGGRPRDAVEPAGRALAAAEAAAAVRHALKSGIVLAVSRAAADPSCARDSVAELDALAATCERAGQLPLVWPARLAAADLLDRVANGAEDTDAEEPRDTVSDAAHRRHAAAATLSVIRQRCDPLGRRLMGESAWVPDGLWVV